MNAGYLSIIVVNWFIDARPENNEGLEQQFDGLDADKTKIFLAVMARLLPIKVRRNYL